MLQASLCVLTLGVIVYRRLAREYPALTALVAMYTVSVTTTVCLLFYRRALHVPIQQAYRFYLWTNWSSSILEFLLQILIIYGLFFEAMKPFPGLQRVGKLVFKWVGSVSLIVSLALASGPELFVKGLSATQRISQVDGRLQQGVGVLILCLLVFVSFSIRPLGLTFRSHIFGVVLGLSCIATVELSQAAWFATTGAHSVYSSIYLFGSLGGSLAIAVWLTYFALPEPKRKMILLPTTSPFFHWNRISEILGDAPGHVAVAGFTPDMLSPAEIEVLTAAISRETALDLAAEEQITISSMPRPVLAEFADPGFAALATTR